MSFNFDVKAKQENPIKGTNKALKSVQKGEKVSAPKSTYNKSYEKNIKH